MFISFLNGHGSTFETLNSLDSGFLSQASLRDVERQRCWKRGTEQRRAETLGLLYGTTERSSVQYR